jgi:hypothetical protein
VQHRVLTVALVAALSACGGDDGLAETMDAASPDGGPVVDDAGPMMSDAGPDTGTDAGPCTMCGDVCADLQRFQAHCGACDNRCDDTERCVAGVCTCAGPSCGSFDDDPLNCGGAGVECAREQFCEDGVCACRPGFTSVGDACRDLRSSRDDCGSAGNPCRDATPVCEDGVCVAACSTMRTDCSGGCVDTDVDVLHCGRCGERCERDELCVAGACTRYRGRGCMVCPCDDCPTETACCSFPGTPDVFVCLDGAACP